MTNGETPPEVAAFFPADHAAVENGKVYVNGGLWDRLGLVDFPSTVRAAFVVVVRAEFRNGRAHCDFSIDLITHDGEPIVAVEGEAGVLSEDIPEGILVTIPVTANLSFALPHPGVYAFRLFIKGTDEPVVYPITVAQVLADSEVVVDDLSLFNEANGGTEQEPPS